ncbi:MAG TPA: PTS sugar transporter subunit IIC, partial [Negativicutes bacterium]|nr:PTS sugar transporter subunit IIC [Negativicutes bacterium]
FMAAASLEKAGKAMGLEVKVETQGATGIENEITAADLARADAAIIASDVAIKKNARFDPIPTLNVGVSEAVKNAKAVFVELLEAMK